jgi:hypothetical protein
MYLDVSCPLRLLYIYQLRDVKQATIQSIIFILHGIKLGSFVAFNRDALGEMDCD